MSNGVACALNGLVISQCNPYLGILHFLQGSNLEAYCQRETAFLACTCKPNVSEWSGVATSERLRNLESSPFLCKGTAWRNSLRPCSRRIAVPFEMAATSSSAICMDPRQMDRFSRKAAVWEANALANGHAKEESRYPTVAALGFPLPGLT
eukprot:s1403_g35.t1